MFVALERVAFRLGSRWRRAGFKESSLPEVAHDERHRHQGDADAGRGEELVDGVRQDEGAGSGRHLGADHGLAEAHFAEHGGHVDSTGGRRRQSAPMLQRSYCKGIKLPTTPKN